MEAQLWLLSDLLQKPATEINKINTTAHRKFDQEIYSFIHKCMIQKPICKGEKKKSSFQGGNKSHIDDQWIYILINWYLIALSDWFQYSGLKMEETRNNNNKESGQQKINRNGGKKEYLNSITFRIHIGKEFRRIRHWTLLEILEGLKKKNHHQQFENIQ